MAKRNPLDPAWLAYLTTSDCFRIADQAIKRPSMHLRGSTAFERQTPRRRTASLSAARKRAAEFVIVALWAEFERFLISFLQRNAGSIARRRPPAFAAAYRELLGDKVERWRIDEILNLFKTVADPGRIGRAKQVKEFRDWIVHRNPKKGSPPQADPATIYALLSGVIEEIRQT